MMKPGRPAALAVGFALATLVGCASAGRSGGARERIFDDWESFFSYYAPTAEVRGECVVDIGRGAVGLRGGTGETAAAPVGGAGGPTGITGTGDQPPPVVEVDGTRYEDGCVPSYLRPEEVIDVQVLSASQAGAILGTKGAGGMIRLTTRPAS